LGSSRSRAKAAQLVLAMSVNAGAREVASARTCKSPGS